VRTKVNDFRRIVDWTVANHNAEHAKDLKWLTHDINSIREAELESGLKRKIVVISHHAPSTNRTSKPSNEGNPWSSAFATDLLGKEESCLNGVQWWIYGHTHYSSESACGEIKLVSNQRGYIMPGKNESDSATVRGLTTKALVALKLLKICDDSHGHETPFDPTKVIGI
jgi:hypothetical protein